MILPSAGADDLVGLYWEPGGDELTVYDRLNLWCGFHRHWEYLAVGFHGLLFL